MAEPISKSGAAVLQPGEKLTDHVARYAVGVHLKSIIIVLGHPDIARIYHDLLQGMRFEFERYEDHECPGTMRVCLDDLSWFANRLAYDEPLAMKVQAIMRSPGAGAPSIFDEVLAAVLAKEQSG